MKNICKQIRRYCNRNVSNEIKNENTILISNVSNLNDLKHPRIKQIKENIFQNDNLEYKIIKIMNNSNLDDLINVYQRQNEQSNSNTSILNFFIYKIQTIQNENDSNKNEKIEKINNLLKDKNFKNTVNQIDNPYALNLIYSIIFELDYQNYNEQQIDCLKSNGFRLLRISKLNDMFDILNQMDKYKIINFGILQFINLRFLDVSDFQYLLTFENLSIDNVGLENDEISFMKEYIKLKYDNRTDLNNLSFQHQFSSDNNALKLMQLIFKCKKNHLNVNDKQLNIIKNVQFKIFTEYMINIILKLDDRKFTNINVMYVLESSLIQHELLKNKDMFDRFHRFYKKQISKQNLDQSVKQYTIFDSFIKNRNEKIQLQLQVLKKIINNKDNKIDQLNFVKLIDQSLIFKVKYKKSFHLDLKLKFSSIIYQLYLDNIVIGQLIQNFCQENDLCNELNFEKYLCFNHTLEELLLKLIDKNYIDNLSIIKLTYKQNSKIIEQNQNNAVYKLKIEDKIQTSPISTIQKQQLNKFK